jgi:mannose-1-phosphate guanylyltransferase
VGLKLAALYPEARFAVLPSDHIILKEQVFVDKMLAAFEFAASQQALVTLGIAPTRPDTGYGYIQFDQQDNAGVHAVKRFVEKPNLETAQSYLDTGGYLWNAGIFVWSAQVLISGLKSHAPDVISVLNQDPEFFNTPAEQDYINRVYPLTPSISIDYALLEKADNVFTIPADIGWSDLGTWASLYTELPDDAQGNVVTHATSMLYNTTDCLVRGHNAGKLIVIKDLHDFIVIDTESVLLIHPKSKEQEIKAVTADVKSAHGERFI